MKFEEIPGKHGICLESWWKLEKWIGKAHVEWKGKRWKNDCQKPKNWEEKQEIDGKIIDIQTVEENYIRNHKNWAKWSIEILKIGTK